MILVVSENGRILLTSKRLFTLCIINLGIYFNEQLTHMTIEEYVLLTK